MDGSKEQPLMTAGLDLGDKYSYLCLIDTLSVCENTSTAFAARPIAGLTGLNGCDIAKAHTSDFCVGVGFPRLFASSLDFSPLIGSNGRLTRSDKVRL